MFIAEGILLLTLIVVSTRVIWGYLPQLNFVEAGGLGIFVGGVIYKIIESLLSPK